MRAIQAIRVIIDSHVLLALHAMPVILLSMKNKSAGERKRTVTVTLGPLTMAIIVKLQAAMGDKRTGMPFTPTDVVTSAVWRGLACHCTTYAVAVPAQFPYPWL